MSHPDLVRIEKDIDDALAAKNAKRFSGAMYELDAFLTIADACKSANDDALNAADLFAWASRQYAGLVGKCFACNAAAPLTDGACRACEPARVPA